MITHWFVFLKLILLKRIFVESINRETEFLSYFIWHSIILIYKTKECETVFYT